MQFNVGVKDLISTGGDSRPSCIQMLANRSPRGSSKGNKMWHSLTLGKKMKVNKFDIASQNPGFPCPHINTEQSFWKKNQLYFLWPKMMFRWGWKAKTHRLKPCFPKFPCACRQTLSKKNIQPSLMTDWKSEIWHGHKSPVTVNTTWKQMTVGSMFTSRNKNSFEMPQTGVFIRTMMISLFFK